MWNALYNFGLSPIPRHDVAPAALSLSGIMVAWGLFRYRLFDIVPVARATVMEGMDNGVVVLDTQNRIVDLNPAAQRILALPNSQAASQTAQQAFNAWPNLIALCCDATVTHTEIVMGDGDGQRYYEVRISPLTDRRGHLIGQVIVLHDITERRRARAQLLQQQRALAVLEERERLARELHDSLGQMLGYVNVQAQAIRELLSRDQKAKADSQLSRLAVVAQDAHADVRESILSLRVAIPPEQGFLPALEQYLRRFEQNYGIRTELIRPDELADGAIEPTVEVQLLRIIQEALSNIRKHAHARSVRVIFTILTGQAQVVVEDDGRGFDPGPHPGPPSILGEEDREGAHFGLRVMRERAEAVGGSLQVCSAPGQGTKVIVQIPLRPSSP